MLRLIDAEIRGKKLYVILPVLCVLFSGFCILFSGVHILAVYLFQGCVFYLLCTDCVFIVL